MKQFDLISDIHLDYWIVNETHPLKLRRNIIKFVNSILPDKKSDILAIAGDLGHFNIQNKMFLEVMREHYKHVLLVFGNHDFYLISEQQKSKYKYDSMNRLEEMKEMADQIENVYYLDGNIVTIDGTTYGGVGMWYDFSYGTQVLGYSLNKLISLWETEINDNKKIKGLPTRTLEMFWNEQSKLESILDDSDVIITHVGPNWSRLYNDYKLDPVTSFYYFDGSKYKDQVRNKIWCFGHTHKHYDFMDNGCWYINNALGYPNRDGEGYSKIVNIPLEV